MRGDDLSPGLPEMSRERGQSVSADRVGFVLAGASLPRSRYGLVLEGRTHMIDSSGCLQRAAMQTVWSITPLDFTHAVHSAREAVAVGRSLRAG